MDSAAKAARELGLNPKTVQQHYHRIRKRITVARETFLLRQLRRYEAHKDNAKKHELAENQNGLFWIIPVDSCICTAFCQGERSVLERELLDHYQPFSLILNRKGEVDQMHLKSLEQKLLKTGANRCSDKAVRFWPYLRNHLAWYRGGYRKNFREFVLEMECRFNRRESHDFDALFSVDAYEPENE